MQFIPGYRLTLFFTFLFIAITAPDCSSSQYQCFNYTIDNITKGFPGNSTSPSISGDGSLITFESTTDITEKNPGGTYQIFIYNTRTGKSSQITTDKNRGSEAPSISGDGAKVAFVSGANIKGNNPEALNIIYLYDTETGEFTQITTEGNSFEPSVNSDGSQIAFTSNMDSNIEAANIFIYESLSGTTTEITDETEQDSVHPQISASSVYIVFESGSILTPGEKTNLFLYDNISGNTKQITHNTAGIGSISASISSDGRYIAFQSDENKDGANPHGNFNIYLYDSAQEILAQITKEPQAGSAGASINGDATLIAFQSSGNFSGENPDGNVEIFLYDNVSSEFRQITDTKSGVENTGSEISKDGRHIVFVYDDSSEEANPEQKSDIYIASCDGKDVSGLSPDMLNTVILIVAIVFGVVLLMMFRRKGE